jgi:hypothetical protein
MTRADRHRGDSLHLLVMDLHKELNVLQAALATESVEGAMTYGLADDDRELVAAFMQGVRRTAPLKFDHPGLGTTAARSGGVLVIQNDIGTTDAHVLVIRVDNLTVTTLYSDVHLQRLNFFASLFARWKVRWDDIVSRHDGRWRMASTTWRSHATWPSDRQNLLDPSSLSWVRGWSS